MKKSSIVLKLFIITILFFSLILGVFITGQTLFFKSFYLKMKVSRLEKNIEKFSLIYEVENSDSTNITRNINKFSDQNNAQIAIVDENGNAKYTPAYEFVMETSDKNKVKIPLNNIAYLEEFQNLKLTVGSEIEVDGLFNDDSNQLMLLSSIKNGSQKWENSNLQVVALAEAGKTFSMQANDTLTTPEGLNPIASITPVIGASTQMAQGTLSYSKFNSKKIEGKIVDIDIPSQVTQMTNYSKELLWSSIGYWNGLWMLKKVNLEPNKTIKINYTNPSNGMDNIVLVKPIIKDNKLAEFIFVVSSLQPVGEAVDVIRVYYLYAFLITLILIAGMSLIFSRIITRPLIKMNQVAVRMADLDFSQELTVKSNDEFGSMAVSLNRLSKNLDISLSELKVANEQLKLDIEKEKELEIMRKEFVSSVSHELKTPLGIIKGFAEGIKDNIYMNKNDYYMDVILDEINKMDELVLDLLDLAKLESRAYKLNKEDFSIIELLKEVESRLISRINEKKIRLKFKYECSNLIVCADKRRIEQVIVNIFNNAIIHTQYEGFIKIVVKENESLAHICIENSGNHISEEDMKRIWERFYRAEKSRDRKTGGIGLGLSIVKNILEMHESQFGVKNTEDGVDFYFTLNISEEPKEFMLIKYDF
jgi:signal transduction histidine kinase